MLYVWLGENKIKQNKQQQQNKQTNKQIKKLSCDAGKPWKNS